MKKPMEATPGLWWRRNCILRFTFCSLHANTCKMFFGQLDIIFNAISYTYWRYLFVNRKFFKIRLFVTDDIMDLTVTFIQWRNGSNFYNGPNLCSLLLRNEAKLFLYLRMNRTEGFWRFWKQAIFWYVKVYILWKFI